MSHVLLLCAHPSSPSWNTAHSAATGPLIRVTETPLATAGSYIQPWGLSRSRTSWEWPSLYPHPLPHPGAGISGVGRDCEPPVPCPDSDVAEGPLHISRHSLTAESPARTSVPVVGIVIGVFLLLTVAAGGALLWRRMRKGLPGVGQEEGGASREGWGPPHSCRDGAEQRPREMGRKKTGGEKDSEGDRNP